MIIVQNPVPLIKVILKNYLDLGSWRMGEQRVFYVSVRGVRFFTTLKSRETTQNLRETTIHTSSFGENLVHNVSPHGSFVKMSNHSQMSFVFHVSNVFPIKCPQKNGKISHPTNKCPHLRGKINRYGFFEMMVLSPAVMMIFLDFRVVKKRTRWFISNTRWLYQ